MLMWKKASFRSTDVNQSFHFMARARVLWVNILKLYFLECLFNTLRSKMGGESLSSLEPGNN